LRPIVILKKVNDDTFWAIPLSSKLRVGSHYYPFDFDGRQAIAMIAQIKLLDRKRLWRKKGAMTGAQFSDMAKSFKALIP
jgi:hypothetical protein